MILSNLSAANTPEVTLYILKDLSYVFVIIAEPWQASLTCACS